MTVGGRPLFILIALGVLLAGGALLRAQPLLSCGDRVEGEISAPGERDLYRFQGKPAEAIQVVGESLAPGLQLEIRVLDPSGVLIGSKSIASPRSGSIKLPVSGMYTLEVRDYFGEGTGSYALSLQFTTGGCAAPIDCGDSREGPVSNRAEQAAFSFEGSAGEAVRVVVGLDSSPSRYPVLEVFQPNGDRLGWSTAGDSGSLVLQENGIHTLILSGFFSFFEQPHPDTYGASLQFLTGRCADRLDNNDVVELEVTSFIQQDAIKFTAGASSWVHVVSEALDYDSWAPQITLFDQLGTEVESLTGAKADFFIPRSGPHTAVLRTRENQRRVYRTRLGLPASNWTAVTERLYQSPVLASVAAFNSQRDQFLAVYAIDVSGFGEYEIYGRRIDGESLQPIGDEFRISRMGPELDPRFQAADPAVVYDAFGDRYLVVWAGENSVDGKFELFGQFLSGDTGAAVGQDDFRITHTGPDGSAAFGAFRPRVIRNPSTREFFLAWHADTRQDGAFDVFGQRLASDGTPVGIPVRLNKVSAASASSSARNPDLAFNPDRSEILVVWQGPGAAGTGPRVAGVRVDAATGAPLSAEEIIISPGSDEQLSASVDAAPAVSLARLNGEYLVVWPSAAGRILGRRVDAGTGGLLGFGSIPINTAIGGTLPAVSHSDEGSEFLVVWQQDLGGGEMEIYGQRIDSTLAMRSGGLNLQISQAGPDGDGRFAARFPSLVRNGTGNGYLVTWSGNARPVGGNHLSATFLPVSDGKAPGDLNWIMSARETPLGPGGLPFSGAVSSAGEEDVVLVGGFGALTRIDPEGTVQWALPPDDFFSAPVGFPLTSVNGTVLVPGKPGQGESVGHLNAVDADGTRSLDFGASEGAWWPLAEGPGSVVYGASSGEALIAIDADGGRRWEFPTPGFTPVTAPVVDPAGRLLFGARDSGTPGQSRIYSISLDGDLDWTLDVDWDIPDGYAIALGPDGTAYAGGPSLGAFSTDGTLEWAAKVGGFTGGASCRPVVGVQGQVLCASGNMIEAFGPSGERIWSFQGDEQAEVFASYVAVDGSGAVYAISTEQQPGSVKGRLYSMDGLGTLNWKMPFPGEGFNHSVPSFDRAGNLYVVSDSGSLLSVWTGNSPPLDGGWSVAGGNGHHSGQRSVTALQKLHFAQFADGAGALASQLILLNPSRDREIEARIRLRDDAGKPMVVDLNGAIVNGELTIPVPAEGLRTIQTDSLGDLQAGSALVESNRRLAGLILFGGTVGLAGVGASAEQLSRFLVPIEVSSGSGLSTGVAMMNLEESSVEVGLRLLDSDGRTLAESTLAGSGSLAAGGHLARFIDGFDWTEPVDFSNFAGLLEISSTGRLSATAIQTRPGQFATMPVTAWSDRQWGKLLSRKVQAQAGGSPDSPYRLQFAQFADGADALFSEILLFNPDESFSARSTLQLRDDSGEPIQVDLNGEVVDGTLAVTLPPLGLRTFKTDGRGALVVGTVTVESDRPLSGVIIFGGIVGLAGVGSSRELADGFLAPMETDLGRGINTGIALVNLEERETILELALLDPDGDTLAKARQDGDQALPPRGHRALFVDQFEWDSPVDFDRFTGLLKVVTDGAIAATVIQTRPGQFATMPVVPIAAPQLQ